MNRNRNPCGPVHLMPVGYGTPTVTCAAPCDSTPIQLRLDQPFVNQQQCNSNRQTMPSYGEAVKDIGCYAPCAEGPSPPCQAPINVHLQMRPVGSSGSNCNQSQPQCIPQCQPKIEPDCWARCKEPPRPPRCPDGNYAERRASMRPGMQYNPSPIPFDGRTTYKVYYVPKMADKVKSFKPEYFLRSDMPKMDGETLYKTEYGPKPVTCYQKPDWAKKAEFVPDEGCISGVTSYKSEYTGKVVDPAKSAKPPVFLDLNKDPFDDRTTYKGDYMKFSSDNYCKDNPVHPGYLPVCTPFNGMTTYRADYVRLCVSPRKPMKQEAVAFKNRDHAETGTTTYRAGFEPFYFNKRCEKWDIPTKHYDQIYPRNPCECMNCCDYYEQRQEPLQRPSPPCPDPCGNINDEPDPRRNFNPGQGTCGNQDWKVNVTNGGAESDPTTITITQTPKTCSYSGQMT